MIPFIRTVILCLFATTVTAFFCGVARVHMAILSCLGGGLLLSISFFMNEYDKVVGNSKNNTRISTERSNAGANTKTD